MKGQYFSFDAIIASVIFVLALVALLSYWHSVRSFLDYQSDPLSREAIRLSNLLFTPPSPSSDCASIERLGFAVDWDDRRVDSSLMNCANSQDMLWLKRTLGTGFNVSIKITNIAEERVVMKIGGDVPMTVHNTVNMRRVVTVVNQDGSDYLATFDLSIYN